MNVLLEAAELMRPLLDADSPTRLVPDVLSSSQRHSQAEMLRLAGLQLREIEKFLADHNASVGSVALPDNFVRDATATIVTGPRVLEWLNLAAVMQTIDARLASIRRRKTVSH